MINRVQPGNSAKPASTDVCAPESQAGSEQQTPNVGVWDSWFDGEAASAEFMNERDQPPDQERESL
jgi:hypothetical protein